ncbi:MAG: aldo/keto reductase [Verrucomicrobiota bacterium]|nr:aldo/keto reductase [Verrucomicrobiota bacterium]
MANKGTRKLNWGILGTGSISHALAKALGDSDTGVLHAIASRSMDKAKDWAAKYGISKAFCSYDDLINDPDVDAIYIALPNSDHALWTIRAANAGKHILCEKPLAINHSQLMVMLEACRRNKVFFMEAFMWRCHPGTQNWISLLKQGTIGDIRMIDAQFSFNLNGNSEHSRMNNELGGGGIMDVGCYCLSAARLIAGIASGQDFSDPITLNAYGKVGISGVDEWAAAILKFPNDVIATVSSGIQLNQKNELRVWGSSGHMVIPSPWFADGRVIVSKDGQAPEEITHPSTKNLYTHEVDMLGTCVRESRLEAYAPSMTWADSLSQQKSLDLWRKTVGVKFDCEAPESIWLQKPFSGNDLTVQKGHNMVYGTIEGINKPISKVIMGTMSISIQDMSFTCAMMDDYFERGGNCVDTAFVYGANVQKGFGKWLALRGVREKMVILGKGAHTAFTHRPFEDPGCDPTTLTKELLVSLEQMGVEYMDLYCMHRDNPLIPVGEFVDVLNEHYNAGRIRSFGGSNWTIKRIEEANAYARTNGKKGFTLLSNNFSLAQWNEPMWGNCVSSSDEASREWLKQAGMPLFAWSSQASGFFTGKFRRGNNQGEAAEVARVWFNDSNFERMKRAEELAAEKGCSSNQIALAYVLNQPFEVYALIGPRTIEETRTSLKALNITLTESELAWLNLAGASTLVHA